jgi:hypothetical protein
MCEGIVEELQGIDLGDKRLNRRSTLVMEALAANPEASVNAAGEGWGDTLAAYRLFNNSAVTPEQILRPHREATQRRMCEHSVVLIVQDTTELDYTKHPTDDAQCLNTEQRFGLYEHVHLAVTPDKLCLGVVGSEFFDRAPESLGKADERRTLPIERRRAFAGSRAIGWPVSWRRNVRKHRSSASRIAKRTSTTSLWKHNSKPAREQTISFARRRIAARPNAILQRVRQRIAKSAMK